MSDPPRARRTGRRFAYAGSGVALVGLAAWLVWGHLGREGTGSPRVFRSPDDVLAYVRAHPDRASLVVLTDGEASPTVALQEGVSRPVPGLTALLLAAEWGRQRAAGQIDAVHAVPASVLRAYALPGPERPRMDTAAVPLDALVRRALGGDPTAADALLDALGRENVEALPVRLGLQTLEPPVPIGGLLLAWAPAGRGGLPAARARAFARLSTAAQRDSAFDRSRAYVTSPAYRSEETVRWERGGLGLAPDLQRELAAATFPEGTAHAYARLLLQAVTDASLAVGPFGDAVAQVGVVDGWADGLYAAAGATATSPQARAVVLILEGLPEGAAGRLAESGAARQLVQRLLAEPSGLEVQTPKDAPVP